MKYATMFDPATCARSTIWFDFAKQVENGSITWFCTNGYSSDSKIDAYRMDYDMFEKLAAIGEGRSRSYWLRRDGGDRDCLSDIHTADLNDAATVKRFRDDFHKTCGFWPKLAEA